MEWAKCFESEQKLSIGDRRDCPQIWRHLAELVLKLNETPLHQVTDDVRIE
jgi:hypothetical protein